MVGVVFRGNASANAERLAERIGTTRWGIYGVNVTVPIFLIKLYVYLFIYVRYGEGLSSIQRNEDTVTVSIVCLLDSWSISLSL